MNHLIRLVLGFLVGVIVMIVALTALLFIVKGVVYFFDVSMYDAFTITGVMLMGSAVSYGIGCIVLD